MSDIDLQHIIDADGTEEWFYLVGSPPVPPPSSPNALAKLVHSVALRNYKRYHREDGPAKIGPDGSQLWYLDGDLHRLNGPAIISCNEHRITDGKDHIIQYGGEQWYCDGKRHRVGGPQALYNDGEEYWMVNDLYHREDDLPAVIEANGLKRWYVDGKLHRIAGPAVTHPTGEYFGKHDDPGPHPAEEWWQNGQRHRIGGPATIFLDGSYQWCMHGKLHRVGGPAEVCADGSENWCQNGKRHRLDGPAVVMKGEVHGVRRMVGPRQDITAEVAEMIQAQGYKPWQQWDTEWVYFRLLFGASRATEF